MKLLETLINKWRQNICFNLGPNCLTLKVPGKVFERVVFGKLQQTKKQHRNYSALIRILKTGVPEPSLPKSPSI